VVKAELVVEPVVAEPVGEVESKPAEVVEVPAKNGFRRGRRGGNGKDRALRQVEKEHIDWIDTLVKLPADPTLQKSKER
jgi:hypothetical protein